MWPRVQPVNHTCRYSACIPVECIATKQYKWCAMPWQQRYLVTVHSNLQCSRTHTLHSQKQKICAFRLGLGNYRESYDWRWKYSELQPFCSGQVRKCCHWLPTQTGTLKTPYNKSTECRDIYNQNSAQETHRTHLIQYSFWHGTKIICPCFVPSAALSKKKKNLHAAEP